METFKCECCQGSFETTSQEPELQDEVELEYRAIVCNDCYQQIMEYEYEHV